MQDAAKFFQTSHYEIDILRKPNKNFLHLQKKKKEIFADKSYVIYHEYQTYIYFNQEFAKDQIC